jgi:hypothetical protein
VVPRDTAISGHEPQVTAQSSHHCTEPVRGNSGRIAFVEDGEVHTVESGDSIECGDLEVSVGSLVHAANYVLRQAIVRLPRIETILCAR